VLRVMTDEQARLVSGYARAGGDAGPARKPEQAWAAAAPSSFLPLLFVANLVRVYHKY
jgi:hypothetical protein